MSGIVSISEPGRAMSAYDLIGLQWTTEPPTEPGLYKAKWKDTKREAWVEVYSVGAIGILAVLAIGNDVGYSLNDFTHWLGPLPIPEPPQE